MIGLYIIAIVLEIILIILVYTIGHNNGFYKGVNSVRKTYLRSLAVLKDNYENVSQIIKELEYDNNTSVESVQRIKN